MPIVSGMEKELPFSDVTSLLEYSKTENLSLGEIGILYVKISQWPFRRSSYF